MRLVRDFMAWRGTDSKVREPMCGVTMTFSWFRRGWLGGGGSSSRTSVA